MGWNDHARDVLDARELPSEAFAGDGDPLDIDDGWLATADEEQQLRAIGAWFLARYCDPVHMAPYSSEDGGYQFISGGPYDPEDVLQDRFAGVVSARVMDQAIEELHRRGGIGWAPIDHRGANEYDENYGVEVSEQDEPLRDLKRRIGQVSGILKLKGPDEVIDLLPKLAFVSVITALESYLWETVAYWLENDGSVLENIVTKIPQFRDKPLKYGEIFKKQRELKKEVLGYLQDLVWHKWESVVPLFTLCLEVEVPSLKQFDEALLKRHNIVHRSGHTKEREAVTVSSTEINTLSAQILSFAELVSSALQAKVRQPSSSQE